MRVGYIYQDQYPWDIRAEKIVTSLSGSDHDVHIISRNRDNFPLVENLSRNLFVHRVGKSDLRLTRTIVNYPAFFSPFWLRRILEVLEERKVDLLIVRDLPMSPTAVFAGWIRKIPVIMDMAENYPAMIRDTWTFRGPRWRDYLFRNPFLLRQMERSVMKKLKGVLTVSEASRARVLRLVKPGIPVWVVRNTPRLDVRRGDAENRSAEHLRMQGELKLLYVGGLEYSRGLDIVVRAVGALHRDGVDICFHIVGEGESRSGLRKLSEELGISDKVIFHGFVEQALVPAIIRQSDICIIPHYVTEHTNTTIPNKIYDYMAQERPVLATNAVTLKEIIETEDCGLVYEDRDHQDLAAKIRRLMDPELRRTLGKNGRRAVLERHHWGMDAEELLKVVNYFQNRKSIGFPRIGTPGSRGEEG